MKYFLFQLYYKRIIRDSNVNYIQSGLSVSAGSAADLVFSSVAGAEWMRIKNNGNIGIGTTTPGATLDVTGTSQFNSVFFRNNTNTSRGSISATNDNLLSIEAFNMNNTAKNPICLAPYGGNVGIGTVNPICSFQVGSQVVTSYEYTQTQTVSIRLIGRSGPTPSISSPGSSNHTGTVSILSTDFNSPTSLSFMNTINIFVTGGVNITLARITSVPVAGIYGGYLSFELYDINNNGSLVEQARINSGGSVLSRTNSYGAISDGRLKHILENVSSEWEDIKSIQFVKFKFKSEIDSQGNNNAKVHLGCIAQQVRETQPGLVDENETPEGFDSPMLSVKYSIIYMKSVIALQEAMKRIETLETENRMLKEQISDILIRLNNANM